MIRLLIIFYFFFLFCSNASASKLEIINNFKNIENLIFEFNQKIDDKIETGKCIVSYPKKILCNYNDFYKKIMVSNGKNLLVNNNRTNLHNIYKLEKTPLIVILDKIFIIDQMNKTSNFYETENNFYFKINFDNNEIIIFFDKATLDIKGWTTKDIYQNKVETKLNNLQRNQLINEDIFDIKKYMN